MVFFYIYPQLSTVAVSPTLSNKDKYPWFFRVSGPELKLNPARLAMMAEFGWQKVAILYQSREFLIAVSFKLTEFLSSTIHRHFHPGD